MNAQKERPTSRWQAVKQGFVRGLLWTTAFCTVPFTASRIFDANARSDLKTALAPLDAKIVQANLDKPIGNNAAKALDDDLDIATELLFECGPQIAAKIDGFKSEDGPELVRKTDTSFIVWQADEKCYDTLENILSIVDGKQTQACVTLHDKDLRIQLGGTNFNVVQTQMDLLYAGTAGLGTETFGGGLSPRAASGVAIADSALKVLHKKHPELGDSDLHVGIIAHSQGAATAAGVKADLAWRGFIIDKTIILSSFGGKAAFDAVEKDLGLVPGSLEKNTVSVHTKEPGPLDHFVYASQDVGTPQTSDVTGHFAKDFAVWANHLRVQAAAKTNN